MEESEKSKKEIKLQKLEASEKSLKAQDEQTITELLKVIGSSKISMKKYIAAINSQVSFNLSIETTNEEE